MILNNSSDTTENAGTSEVETAPDLRGEWKQISVDSSSDSYMTATIDADAIVIYWDSDDEDSKFLYWAGTYIAPESNESYSWDSENDYTQTDSSILASGAETKTITYENGILSFEVTVSGSTYTVEMEQVETSSTTVEETTTTVEETTTIDGEGTLGSYYVKIKNSEIVTSYEGDPAIAITVSFTNNSDDAVSFGTALSATIYQDGIELDSAYVSDIDDNEFTKIKSGKTIDVIIICELNDTENPVEIEIEKSFSRTDTIVSKTFELS